MNLSKSIRMACRLLDLGKGHPNPSYLPLQELLHQTAPPSEQENDARLAAASEALQYGDERGSVRFRLALFSLMKDLRPSLHEESFLKQVMQTNGASQGLDMVCAALTQPGDTVLVETPTYFYAKNILDQHKLNVIQVPVNHGGDPGRGSSCMDLDALERMLQQNTATQQPRLLYTVPVCNNPMGHTMSYSDGEKLVQLAHRFGFRIVADEVYLLLQFGALAGRQDRAVSLFDLPGASEVVVSLNSFSKILGPGIRLGWLEANKRTISTLIQSTGYVQSGGGLNPFSASLVSAFIERGTQQTHIQFLCAEYHRRYMVLAKALETHLGAESVDDVAQVLGATCRKTAFVRANGGFFVWLRFASHMGIHSEDLLKEAMKSFDVKFFTATRFLIGSDTHPDRLPLFAKESIRLCFTYLEEDDLEEAVRRIARAVEWYVSNAKPALSN